MRHAAASTALLWPLHGHADEPDSLRHRSLDEVEIVERKPGIMPIGDAVGGQLIGRSELFRAACCNLGESFSTNPSVDVNYTDAATGAKQIRLLGLSGRYVQMLVETMPVFRGPAMPFALDYVPGTWMQSIQVSKGAASVKNGMDAITGQINVEYLKSDADDGLSLNGYANTEGAIETNIDASASLSERWSTVVMGHFNTADRQHDGNGDGFQDMPQRRQYNIQNRWKYRGDTYLLHFGAGLVRDYRHSGQLSGHDAQAAETTEPYRIDIDATRIDAYMKHAWILNKEHNANIAWMTNYSFHTIKADFGSFVYAYIPETNHSENANSRYYNPDYHDFNSQLMYETDLGEHHNISVGASLRIDYIDESLKISRNGGTDESELSDALAYNLNNTSVTNTLCGLYGQYTYTLGSRLTAMAGLRMERDYAHTFAIPRLHLKYSPASWATLRLSAGRGVRYFHTVAENFGLLASSRDVTISAWNGYEKAWNGGLTAAFTFPLAGRTMKIKAEYYYTRFQSQLIADMETAGQLDFYLSREPGTAHTAQVDATYSPFKGFQLTAAYRYNRVRQSIDGKPTEPPLQSRYKGLVSASYKTPLGLWQFDLTAQLNGGGRMPASLDSDVPTTFKAYPWLSAQVTRQFRHIAIYAGGENLTGYKQRHPVAGYQDPYGTAFDATMVYGPLNGAMLYIGFRLNIGRTTSL